MLTFCCFQLWPDILQVLAPNDDIEIIDDICHELRGYEDLTVHFHNFLKDQLGATVELITVQDWLNSHRVMSEDECLTDSQIVQIINEEEEAIEEEKKGVQRRIKAVLQSKDTKRRLQNKDDTIEEGEKKRSKKRRKTKSGKGGADPEEVSFFISNNNLDRFIILLIIFSYVKCLKIPFKKCKCIWIQ